MESRSRSIVAVGAVAVLLVLAGCNGAPGGGTPTPSATEYHEPASEYLLSAETLVGWEDNGTRAPGAEPAGMESGQVLELKNGTANLQIAVLVFESPADARTFLDAQRETYRSEGINTTDVTIGDRAFGVPELTGPNSTIAAVDAQESNVYVQVTGNVPLNASERIARTQLRAITGG
ncbi:hypothetical protein SAMN05216388_100746 [Halorientalis persicus]|jgi:hypothetical protein|uniref:Uncharacterized protein n=1 Tax=Halorientalis persicus TaxID=1367881 RepID=A0A1H8L854_9EURY|nr:hypothetical protein [Halorientalis persicus]SEO01293.1 hypothetical protein SAMN05216388_100746 [Halorientalis persicus]